MRQMQGSKTKGRELREEITEDLTQEGERRLRRGKELPYYHISAIIEL
jgi:hypothetical protein